MQEAGEIREVKAEDLSLDKPSVVRLKLAPEKVKHFERRGNDLVLLLQDGSETVVKDFFVVYDNDGRNDLLLEDDEGVMWWGQYTSPWSNFHFTEIEWDDAALIPPWHHGGWLAAALGLLGAGVAAGSGGGSSGSVPGGSGGDTEEGVTPPVKPPVLVTPENQPIGGQIENKNPSAGTPTYSKGSDPEHGTVTLKPDGTYLYTPNPGYHGPDSFTVVVKNPDGTTSTVTVNVTVTPVNDEPEAPDYSHKTPEDTPVTGKVVGTDPDGDPLTYTEGTPPKHGTVTLKPDGSYEYVPNKNWSGTDTFEVIVTDPDGETTTSTITVVVDPVNDAPEAPDYSHKTPEDTPVTGTVVGTDPDGDPLTYTEGTPPKHGTVTLKPDGSYEYVPNKNWSGTDTFEVIVTDPDGETTTSTITVVVDPVNDAPEAPDYSHKTPEDTPVTGTVVGTDPDGDPLTYTEGTPPKHGTVTLKPDGSYEYVPNKNWSGTDTFEVIVTDPDGETTTSTITVIVTPEQDPPVASPDQDSGPEGAPVHGNLVTNDLDPDGDLLTVTEITVDGSTYKMTAGSTGNIIIPGKGTLVVKENGDYSFTPNPGWYGTVPQVSYTISDGNGGQDSSTLDITVTGSSTNTTATVNESGMSSGSTNDGSNISTGKVPAPPVGSVIVPSSGTTSNGTFEVKSDGTYTFTLTKPSTDVDGAPETNTFTYITRDEGGNEVTHTVTVTITDDAPTATDDSSTVSEGGLLTSTVGVLDNDKSGADGWKSGGAVVGVVAGNSQGTPSIGGVGTTITGKYGTLTLNPDGSYTYKANADSITTDEQDIFTYTVEDADGDRTTATLTIDVTNVGVPGTTTNGSVDEAGLPTGSSASSNSEVSSGSLNLQPGFTAVASSGTTANGSYVVNADGTYTFTLTSRTNDGTGSETNSFTYTAQDAQGNTVTNTVLITIADDAPTARDDVNTVTEDTVLTANGNVIGGAGAASTDVADTRGADGATVTGAQAGPVSGGGHVPDGGVSTSNGAPIVLQGTYGTLVIHADGSYTYTLDNSKLATQGLNAADVVNDVFSYTLTDGDGDKSTASLRIEVKGSDDGVTVSVPTNDTATTPDGINTDHVVFESGLNGGTSPSSANTEVVSSFTIDAKDGLDPNVAVTLTCGGQTLELTKAELEALGITHKQLTTQYGTLELTGYSQDPITGQITVDYTYTLTSAPNVSGTDTRDTITITAKDRDGDTNTAGSINIKVVDDAPQAIDQAGVTLAEGVVTVGNIVGSTWSAGTSNLLGNDKQGADGARVHQVEYTNAAGQTVTATITAGTPLVLTTQYGTLTVNSDGSWKYISNPNAPHPANGDLQDGFRYTLIDNDGDVSNWAQQPITVTDTAPTLGTPVNGTVDEDDLAAGTDSSKESLSVSGSLAVTKGADAIDTKLSVDTAPAGLTSGGVPIVYGLSADGHTLTAYKGSVAVGNEVFTVTVTDPTGASGSPGYTFTLQGQLDHAPGGMDNDQALSFGFEAKETDAADGDKVNGSFTITVKDDIPVITQNTSGTQGVQVDETNLSSLGTVGTSNLSGLFNVNLGADGAASSDAIVYALGLKGGASDNVDSGLKDTVSGAPVTLSISGDTIAGTVIINGVSHTVFTLKLDPATGEVTLTQFRAMQHADKNNSDDVLSFAKDVINLSVTATDRDGDAAKSTVDIGDRISFKDDGPSITGNVGNAPAVVVDESNLGNASASTSAGFAGAFTPVFGADGAGSLSYALSVGNATSGLVDTATGQAITLVLNNGVIEGRVGSTTTVAFTISVDGNGSVTLTQSRALSHPDKGNYDEQIDLLADAVRLTATIKDGDGDSASSTIDIGNCFGFRDDGPNIGTPSSVTVNESALANGSAPNSAGLTVTGTLDLKLGADNASPTVTQADTRFSADLSTLEGLGLRSGGALLEYVLSSDGHTLTAYKGAGRAASDQVFVATITNPASNAGYSFVLKAPLDHGADATKDLPFDFLVTDGDGDTAGSTFTVTVVDDQPVTTPLEITVGEDSSYATTGNSFNTSADAQVTIGTHPQHGSVVVDSATGKISYEPNGDYSGSDSFTYTVTNDDGSTTTRTVNVTVTPKADAPDMDGSGPSTGGNVTLPAQSTSEDTPVSLGLKAPAVTDSTDQNESSTITAGDAAERLGLITLSINSSGATNGIKLTAAADGASPAVDITYSGQITILLTDRPYPADLPISGNVVRMTSAQFEALQLTPGANQHENITVTVVGSSYEVDDGGNIATINGVQVPSATSTATVSVDVLAVTDTPTLTLTQPGAAADAGAVTLTTAPASGGVPAKITAAINEDGTLKLQSVLSEGFTDLDGTERFWYEITGLPEGTVVSINGKNYTAGADGTVTMTAADYMSVSSATPNPSFSIKPPANYSNSTPIAATITLKVQDRDSDSSSATPAIEQVSVELELRVYAHPDNVTLTPALTTTEDTAVKFLASLGLTDTDGSETITQVRIGDLPAGWTVHDHNGNAVTIPVGGLSLTVGGSYTLEQLKEFKVTPAAHSSADGSFSVYVTTTETSANLESGAPASKEWEHSLNVTVTPVAEEVGKDSDGNGTTDLTMTPGHKYNASGEEDKWFSLGVDGGFKLADGWANQDADEKTYARLTPELIDGDGSIADASGSQFRYSTNGVTTEEGGAWVVVPLTNGYADIPVEYLETLQFLAAPNFSGRFNIKVVAYTVDTDPDTGAESTKVSGGATLENILIKPVADEVTLALNGSASGKEDTLIPLSINPTSSDPSESLTVTIKGIPAGSKLFYGGQEVTVSAGGEVSIPNYNASLGVSIQPPPNSNDDFTLKVSAKSLDKLTADGMLYESEWISAELDLKVSVKGVADEAVVTIKSMQTYTEADLDSGSATVNLKDMVSVALPDGDDGSEKLTVRVTGLPDGFTLSGGTVLEGGSGENRVWLLTEAQLATVYVKVPANYSGTVNFTVAGVATENDGDSSTGTPKNVSFTVTPSAEATASTAGSITEDVIGSLNFGIVHQNGDTDETLKTVWIKVADAGTGASGDAFTLYLGTGSSAVTLAQAVTDGLITQVDRGGVQYYELSADQAANLAAKGKAQADGNLGNFHYEYQVVDSKYGATSTGNDIKTGSADFTVTANAVTDPVNVELGSVQGTTVTNDGDNDVATTTVNGTGIVIVNLDVTSADMDGSEHVIRVLIEGVPVGVTVTGAQQTALGTWLLVYEGPDAKQIAGSGLGLPVEFVIGPDAAQKTGNITFTVQAQDNGDQAAPGTDRVSDSVGWTLHNDFTTAPGSAAPTIDEWTYNNNYGTEDTSFSLNHVVDGKVTLQDNSQPNVLTVTLTDVPAGVTISGMTQTWVTEGGVLKPVWTASVTVPAGSSVADGQKALDDLLDKIKVTPVANSNENNAVGELHFNATLTASVAGGSSNVATIDDSVLVVPVAPVTDDANLSITVGSIGEGTSSIPVSVTVGTADGQYGQIVDGKLYLQLNSATSDNLEGDVLNYNGSPVNLEAVSGVPGIASGNYYVIDVGSSGGTFNMTYTPPVSQPGTVQFDVYVQTKEADASGLPATNVNTTQGSSTGTIQPINNGVTINSPTVTGKEPGSSDKTNAIELTGDGGLSLTLNDADGSESIGTILLSNVPVGFLVYVSDGQGNIVLADNAGLNGSTNTWLLSSSGGLPSYVAILPPKNWSGTLSGLKLSVESGENSIDTKLTETSTLGDIKVTPVADGLTLNTTVAFGSENKRIALNLNAAMKDSVAASASLADGSTETTTLKLTGLGQYASFYVNGTQLAESQVTYNPDGSYTISGLSQSDLDKLEFLQAKGALVDQDSATTGLQIGVEAWTVESSNGATSAHVNGSITLNVSNQSTTSGADTLLWTGSTINGGSGNDTVSLRHGEDLSGNTLAGKLKNVEALDLSVGGENKITDLSAQNVLDILGSTRTLTVHGDAQDSVDLKNLGGNWAAWTHVAGTDNWTSAYTGDSSKNVTVTIDSSVNVTVDGAAPVSLMSMRSASLPDYSDLLSTDSGSINLDNVLPASSQTTTTLAAVAADSSAADSSALYAPLPQSALDDELNQLSVAHY